MKVMSVLVPALFVAVTLSFAGDMTTSSHVMLNGAEMKWGDAPPVFPKGAKFAVLSGDPGKEGMFVVRLKMPAGYRIAPHWHPTDEHVTVIKGTFALGMGDSLESSKAKTLMVGAYALLPANMHHYAIARTAVVVEICGMGPFVLTYVNPADDPSKK